MLITGGGAAAASSSTTIQQQGLCRDHPDPHVSRLTPSSHAAPPLSSILAPQLPGTRTLMMLVPSSSSQNLSGASSITSGVLNPRTIFRSTMGSQSNLSRWPSSCLHKANEQPSTSTAVSYWLASLGIIITSLTHPRMQTVTPPLPSEPTDRKHHHNDHPAISSTTMYTSSSQEHILTTCTHMNTSTSTGIHHLHIYTWMLFQLHLTDHHDDAASLPDNPHTANTALDVITAVHAACGLSSSPVVPPLVLLIVLNSSSHSSVRHHRRR